MIEFDSSEMDVEDGRIGGIRSTVILYDLYIGYRLGVADVDLSDYV